MGGGQNYGPFLGYPKYEVPYYNKDPKKDHNFDNHPYDKDPTIQGTILGSPIFGNSQIGVPVSPRSACLRQAGRGCLLARSKHPKS